MPKLDTQLPFSNETLVRMLICLGGILLLFFLVVLPAFQRSSELDVKIAQRQVDIAEQEMLFPVYAQLKAELEKERAETLPVPEVSLLRQDELAEVIRSIETSASSAGFKVVTVNPDPKSLEDDQGLLLVNCRFLGPYSDFRDVVISLGSVPYVKYVGKVIAEEAYNETEFTLELWLAMKETAAS